MQIIPSLHQQKEPFPPRVLAVPSYHTTADVLTKLLVNIRDGFKLLHDFFHVLSIAKFQNIFSKEFMQCT
jgi:hypothetical protein